METRYQVCCLYCGNVWLPQVRSSLWWQAKARSEQGYLDALPVQPTVCGCQKEIIEPDAPYRVFGYTDTCDNFDYPFASLVEAAKKYLEIAREGMSTVFFATNRTVGTRTQTRVEKRLQQLEWMKA